MLRSYTILESDLHRRYLAISIGLSAFILSFILLSLKYSIILPTVVFIVLFSSLTIIVRPYYCLYILIFIIYWLPGFAQLVGLEYSEDRLFWVLAFLQIFILLVYSTKSRIILSKIDKIMIIYFFLLIFTALIGVNTPFIASKGILNYVQFPVIYFFVKTIPLSQKHMRIIFQIILVTILVQIPLVIIQRIMIIGADNLSPDIFTGSLGKGMTGHLGVLMAFGFSIIFSRIIIGQRGVKNYLLMLSLIVPSLIASAKFGFILFALISISLIVIFKKGKYSGNKIKSIIIVFLFIISIFTSFKYLLPRITNSGNYTYELFTTPQKMIEYAMNVTPEGYAVGKIVRIIKSVEFISEDLKTIVFGYGPGTLSTSLTFGGQSVESSQIMSVIGPSVGVSMSLVEIGFAGMFVQFLLLYYLYKRSMIRYRNTHDIYYEYQIIVFVGMLICFSVSTIYIRPFTTPISSFVFWVFASILEKRTTIHNKVNTC